MDQNFINEPMLDVFVYETTQNISQLEDVILASEKAGCFSPETVNEIFRVMHTIKGSAAMMMFNNIASLAHAIEDLFYYIRDKKPEGMDHGALSDLVLDGIDFIKLEMEKVKNTDTPDGDPAGLIEKIEDFLHTLKGDGSETELLAPDNGSSPRISSPDYNSPNSGLTPGKNDPVTGEKIFEAVISFEEGCGMENIRAFAIINSLKDIVDNFNYLPEDIIDNPGSAQEIRENGFKITLQTKISPSELHEFFMKSSCVSDVELHEYADKQKQDLPDLNGAAPQKESRVKTPEPQEREQADPVQTENKSSHQNIISVDVVKLDKLMDLMGEMVIAEAMVTQNPELMALQLNSFEKAARQLRKITGEMQDTVMAIRMVPLTTTFHKMHRIVRDMSRKLGKKVELTLIGEGTEVDKNIIEHISDPLMHLVRNAVDHGIEMPEERVNAGKSEVGQITLEAKNAGSDVLILVRDDGSGLNKAKILKKATERGLINKTAELTDKEIYNMVLLPGFSTNEQVTEYSGRGVGMDVVTKNLEAIGGSVTIDSAEGIGTVTVLKIPLTLAIIDGMNIRVGVSKYTIPTTSIRETFRAKSADLINDPEGNEMIMVRGDCLPVLRLHRLFNVKTEITELTDGIMLMLEQDDRYLCLFADELLGQHQVVVKTLPSYMKSIKKVEGLAGCTLLGDGSISLILNIDGLLNMV